MLGSRFRKAPKQPAPLPDLLTAESPELRLIAKRAGVEPTRLARGIADPLGTHLKTSDLQRIVRTFADLSRERSLASKSAVVAVWPRLEAAIDTAIAHKTKEQSNA